jgi:hypothetical protein
MTQWNDIAKKNILSRDWTAIRNVWAAAAIGLDADEIQDLEDVLEPIVTLDGRPNPFVFSLRGRHVAALHDMVTSLMKCAYVIRATANCYLGGQPTWACVDAYHVSLVACRALLGLLGIAIVRIQDTSCVVDVFPEGVEQVHRAAFKKQGGSVGDPVRIFYRTRSSLVEQSAMWALLIRALRVADLPASIQESFETIIKLEAGFGRPRNDILYRNSSWIYEPDLRQPLTLLKVQDDIFSFANLDDFFLLEKDASFAFCNLLIRVLVNLVGDVHATSGADLIPSSYANWMWKFTGFGAQSLRVLSTTAFEA